MKSGRLKGFTIVEISIVIAVVSILAIITVFANNQVQLQARDKKRQSDMQVLQVSLENYYSKNGDYPTGFCLTSSYWTGCDAFNNNVPLETFTTNSGLNTVLENIPAQFGDPLHANGTSLLKTSGTLRKGMYFYLGGYSGPSTGSYGYTVFLDPPMNGQNYCNYSYSGFSAPKRYHPYIIGYYSEVESKWKFYKSPMKPEMGSQWTFPLNSTNQPQCIPTQL